MAIFVVSRVKNLSTAGTCANLYLQEERKGNLVDPASSHMLVSKTNSFSRGQISGCGARKAIFTISRVKNLSTAGPCANLRFRKKEKETWLILPVVICLSQRLIHSAVGKLFGFGARMAIFTISRVNNLSTAGPCANLRLQKKRKGNLVDPASSHMLVSKTK